MKCQRCDSERILSARAHCSDSFAARLDGEEYFGYVPTDLGIADDSDDMKIKVCMQCGQLQGTWPNTNTLPKDEDE